MIHKRRRSVSKPPCLSDVALAQVNEFIRFIETWTLDGAEDWPEMAYLKQQFKSKYRDDKLVSKADRSEAAIEKWLATETRNAEYNRQSQRLGTSTSPLTSDRFALEKEAIVLHAREFIESAIGSAPPADMIRLLGSFSGGASTGYRRQSNNLSRKYGSATHITKLLYHWLKVNGGVEESLGVPEDSLEFVPGNILFTVPKKTEIDRVACKEPDWNCFCQKAAGSFIRRSLRPFGIDLNDQSRNRELAREGSRTGAYSTIDLSSASDTLTLETVRMLVPEDWYRFFYAASSRQTSIKGRGWHRNAMLGSMGNGFTFELESLIFYSIVRAVRRLMFVHGRLLVYGDDIVVPTPMAQATLEVLGAFGFIPNYDKTFIDGPFKESCGGHYHNGADITPFYIRSQPSDIVDLITILNGYRRWMVTTGMHHLDARFSEWWSKLAIHVPESVRGGYDFGDSSILVSYGRRPIARAVKVTKPRRAFTPGALIQWFSQTQASPSGEIDRKFHAPPKFINTERWRASLLSSLESESLSVLYVVDTLQELKYQKVDKTIWYAFREDVEPIGAEVSGF